MKKTQTKKCNHTEKQALKLKGIRKVWHQERSGNAVQIPE